MPNDIKQIPSEHGYIEVLSWGCGENYDLFEQNKIKPNYQYYLSQGLQKQLVGHSSLRIVTPKTKSVTKLLNQLPESCLYYEEVDYYPNADSTSAKTYYEVYFSWWPAFFSLNPFKFMRAKANISLDHDYEAEFEGKKIPKSQRIGIIDLNYHSKKTFKVIDQTLNSLLDDLNDYAGILKQADADDSRLPESHFFITIIHFLDYIDDANLMEVSQLRQNCQNLVNHLTKKKWSLASQKKIQSKFKTLLSDLNEIVQLYQKQKNDILMKLDNEETETNRQLEKTTKELATDKIKNLSEEDIEKKKLEVNLLRSKLYGNLAVADIHNDLTNIEFEIKRLTQLCSNPDILTKSQSSSQSIIAGLKEMNNEIKRLEKAAIALNQKKLKQLFYYEGKAPDGSVIIPLAAKTDEAKLDAESMLTEVVKLHASASYYCLALNCSRAIRSVLEAGIGKTAKLPDIFHKRPLIETPQSIYELSMMLKIHFQTQDRPIESKSEGKKTTRSMTIGSIEYYHVLLIDRVNAMRERMSTVEDPPVNYDLLCQCEKITIYAKTLLERSQISRKMANDIGRACYDLTISPAHSLAQFQQTMRRYNQSKNPVLQMKLFLHDLLNIVLKFISQVYEPNSLDRLHGAVADSSMNEAVDLFLQTLQNACRPDDDDDFNPFLILGMDI